MSSDSTPSEDGQRQGLGRTAARGVTVTLAGQGGRLALQLVGIAILARLLDPADYGLIAMVTVFVNLGEIFREFGLSAAAIQAPVLTRTARDNLFWANTVLGLALFAACGAAAPLVADVFEQPSLTAIARALAGVFLLNGMATQFRASLTRDMRFKGLAVSEVAAQILGLGMGITGALVGWGYWALVAMQLTQAAAVLVFLWLRAGWLPRRPRRGAGMGAFWRFGGHLMGSQVLGFVSNNVDSFVIGRRFGPVTLGVYDRAYRLLMAPLAQIRTPATTVALPILARLNQQERRFGDFICRAQTVLGYTLIPALAIVAGSSTPLVAILLGPQWGESAPILGLLAVAGALQTLPFVGYWVYLSRGLTHKLLQYSVVSTFVRAGMIIVGSQWGVIGVAVAVAAAPAVLWPLSLWWLSRLTVIPVRELIGGATRILLVALVGGLAARSAVWLTVSLPSLLQVVAAAVACVLIYGIAALLPAIRADLRAVAGLRSLLAR